MAADHVNDTWNEHRSTRFEVYSILDKSSRSEPNIMGGWVGVARRVAACRAIARTAGARRGARARVRVGARGSAWAHGV